MPTPGDAHVNQLLTNLSVAYLQGQDKFVASKIFPVVKSTKQSNRYTVYNKGDILRNEATVRAPGAESAGTEYRVDTTPNFFCDPVAIHMDVDWDESDNADAPMSPERDAAEILVDKILMKREKDFVESYFQDGVWDVDWDGVSGTPGSDEFKQWDASSSTPVADVENARNEIHDNTGLDANVLVLGRSVFSALKSNSDILDRIKYTQRGLVTKEILASVFEVDEVIVPGAVENTAAVGATDSIANLWGKHALLAYRAPRPSLMRPSAGYIFTWTGRRGAGAEGLITRRIEVPLRKATRIENEMAYDMKVVASDCGAFLEDAVS